MHKIFFAQRVNISGSANWVIKKGLVEIYQPDFFPIPEL